MNAFFYKTEVLIVKGVFSILILVQDIELTIITNVHILINQLDKSRSAHAIVSIIKLILHKT